MPDPLGYDHVMSNEILWAPWRLGYVQGRTKGEPAGACEPAAWRAGAEHGCFLCRAAAVEPVHDRPLGVLERTPLSVVLLNRYPYSNGHLLVAPLDHRAGLEDLGPPQLLDLQECLVRWCRVLSASMQSQGFNIGLNVGAVAGAGTPGHLHWHVVPRWNGDVNFMPTIAGTRVLPQSLDSLWQQLTAAGASGRQDPRPAGDRP